MKTLTQLNDPATSDLFSDADLKSNAYLSVAEKVAGLILGPQMPQRNMLATIEGRSAIDAEFWQNEWSSEMHEWLGDCQGLLEQCKMPAKLNSEKLANLKLKLVNLLTLLKENSEKYVQLHKLEFTGFLTELQGHANRDPDQVRDFFEGVLEGFRQKNPPISFATFLAEKGELIHQNWLKELALNIQIREVQYQLLVLEIFEYVGMMISAGAAAAAKFGLMPIEFADGGSGIMEETWLRWQKKMEYAKEHPFSYVWDTPESDDSW